MLEPVSRAMTMAGFCLELRNRNLQLQDNKVFSSVYREIRVGDQEFRAHLVSVHTTHDGHVRIPFVASDEPSVPVMEKLETEHVRVERNLALLESAARTAAYLNTTVVDRVAFKVDRSLRVEANSMGDEYVWFHVFGTLTGIQAPAVRVAVWPEVMRVFGVSVTESRTPEDLAIRLAARVHDEVLALNRAKYVRIGGTA